MRWTCLLLGFLICTFQPALAGHSPPKVILRINIQTTGDGLSAQEATTISLPPNGERIQVRTLPELTELNLIGVQQDASGLHLQFDHVGTVNLSAATAENQGRIMVLTIDNFIFYAPIIDEQISNGHLDVPHQVPAEVLGYLQQLAQENVRRAART